MKTVTGVLAILVLSACSDSSAPDDTKAAADYEVQFRFINLSRDVVALKLDGEESGVRVWPLGSVLKGGHTSRAIHGGGVGVRNVLESGEVQAVTLPIEFDATDDEPVTFVARDSMPNRISTGITVAKKNRGATFGERAAASLEGVEVEGGVDTSGDCLTDVAGELGTQASVGLYNEPPAVDCDVKMSQLFVRPAEVAEDATPYFVRSRDGELQVAWVGRVQSGMHSTGSVVAQGASLLGGALPGGAVLGSAVSRLYVLNAHSAATPVTVTIDGVVIASDVAPGALVQVPARLVTLAARHGVDGDGARRGALVEVTGAGIASSFTLAGAPSAACRAPVLCDFLDGEDTLIVVSENLDSSATVLKTKHDTVKNSINNVRGMIVFGSTSALASKGCVSVHAGDDSCVMGAATVPAAVSALSGTASGGASSAAYAATGRLLYPPKALPNDGSSMIFGVVETDAVSKRYAWTNPPGLSPSPDQAPEGFAIVASGAVLDPASATHRALFFVSTRSEPWTVEAALAQ